MSSNADQTIRVRAEYAASNLLQALIQELRLLPKPWPALPAAEQEEIIERLRNRVSSEVLGTIAAIMERGQVALQADLTSIAFRDGLKVTLSAAKDAAGRHDLVDALGRPVTLLLGVADLLAGMGNVKADPDQPGLDLSAAADEAIRRAKKALDDPDPPPEPLP
jgi:hypothetical protein